MQEYLEKVRKINFLKLTAKGGYSLIPETPGVYIFFQNFIPIYIGKAINLKRRVRSYFDLDLETKTKKMITSADAISYIQVTSELESLLLEAKLIRKYMPQYNILAKDDKNPLYIRITKENYPRVITARKISEKEKNIAFYGPFPSSYSVRYVLKMLRRIFHFSDHKLGKRPCLYSHIGLCSPCPNEIVQSKDEKSLRIKYLNNIKGVKKILDGKIDKVKAELGRNMIQYSNKENFEEAANFREKLRQLEYITRPQMPVDSFMENPNLYQDLRARELKDLTQVLKDHGNLRLVKNIKRIECYDIAHLSGTKPTASMVTFIGAEADKKYYRHFRIRQKKGNSDTDSMKEIIKRRIKHFKDWGEPDLIIVDGGKAQLGVFQEELSSMKIPVVGLAKRYETIVFSSSEYRLKQGPALSLVQRMRDEAHRFARRYHHKLLSKSILNEKPA